VFSRFTPKLGTSGREARAKWARQTAFGRAAATAAKEFILRPGSDEAMEFITAVDRIALHVGREDQTEALQIEFVEKATQFAQSQKNEVDEMVTGMADSMEEMIGGISASIALSHQRVNELNQIRQLIDKAETATTIEESRTLLNAGMAELQKLVEQELHTQRELSQSRDTYSTMLRDRLEHLEQQNRIDPLTGIANRAGIERHVKLVLDHCRTNKTAYSFAILDLDGFKAVNDTFGHLAGDSALVAFSQRLTAALGSKAFLGRLGGDEFVVVSANEPEMLTLLLHRLNENLEERPIVFENRSLDVTASFGVQAITPIATFEDLHKLADIAMYNAKRQRKTPKNANQAA
jgi:diguanylate cyclase (GGDEF)-like protein